MQQQEEDFSCSDVVWSMFSCFCGGDKPLKRFTARCVCPTLTCCCCTVVPVAVHFFGYWVFSTVTSELGAQSLSECQKKL